MKTTAAKRSTPATRCSDPQSSRQLEVDRLIDGYLTLILESPLIPRLHLSRMLGEFVAALLEHAALATYQETASSKRRLQTARRIAAAQR